uniref:AlNc14C92G5713 protein n=1 Tax=Albugo laibachii Nc14 TaxID=890382 RepID=F0WGH9_9STRA|nr:AlNc14C92G5713 [Albugo laibachii Nc14]|eukprot:CCA20343.1 AlNc14C92G5713 [Albugo laibachii Nc14]
MTPIWKPSSRVTLLIKPQEKHYIQLFSIESCPVNGVERASEEAKKFVVRVCKLAARHCERDLLWTRLLYHRNLNLTEDIAATYG